LGTISRVVTPSRLRIENTRRTFSNFRYVESEFGGATSIRRLFSLSRGFDGKTLVLEDIRAVGIVAEENAEMRKRFRDHRMTGLVRVTFWKSRFDTESELRRQKEEDLLGYAILKHDIVPSHPDEHRRDQWHVFESVFVKYPHDHNYIHCAQRYVLQIGKKKPRRFHVSGVLYCQQNGINKACAQVALRTLLEPLLGDGRQLSYERIHRWAKGRNKEFNPGKGLTSGQIERVLKAAGFRSDEFSIVDYEHSPSGYRRSRKYQNYLYVGIECGMGALLGFKFTGPKAPEDKHIIPVFGHTFNQDAWASNADAAYFNVGSLKWIQSQAWVSSFVAHDDNFGPNYCIPRLYVTPGQVEYVLAIHPKGVREEGVTAEVVGARYTHSLLRNARLDTVQNEWLRRLMEFGSRNQFVLRTIPLSREAYGRHIAEISDWHRRKEHAEIPEIFKHSLPRHLWLVEISIPELFPINKRKLGEIVLDGSRRISDTPNFQSFLFARLPGSYWFVTGMNSNGEPTFDWRRSRMESHTPLAVSDSTADAREERMRKRKR
jgi:hypothetical protein